MITSLRLVDFKSFADQQVKLGPVSILLGPNGSGKSNFIEALLFLKGVALGMSVDDVIGGTPSWPGIRGGHAGIGRAGSSHFSLASRSLFGDGGLGHSISCTASVAVTEEALVMIKEGLPDIQMVTRHLENARWFADNRPGVTMNQVAYPVETRLRDTRSLLGQVDLFETSIHDGALNKVIALRESFRGIFPVDLDVARLRSYVPLRDTLLDRDGTNLSSVLFKLCESVEVKNELVDWVSELCVPEVVDIDFSKTDEGFVLLRLVEKDGRRVPAFGLSDGTLRFLGLLAALFNYPPGSIVAFEEPDVGLHPPRIHLLAELLESVTQRRKLQVIATTHSPALLERLSPHTLEDAIAFGRDLNTRWTTMARLGDMPDFPALRDSRDVGHLFATGWLEQAL